jgi:hypothetical protein
MPAEVFQDNGSWVLAVLFPAAVLIAVGAIFGSRWSRRRERQQ